MQCGFPIVHTLSSFPLSCNPTSLSLRVARFPSLYLPPARLLGSGTHAHYTSRTPCQLGRRRFRAPENQVLTRVEARLPSLMPPLCVPYAPRGRA